MAKLTWEEWHELSSEEQQKRLDEKPDGPDPLAGGYYVDGEGKKHPIKNLIGEASRKAREEILKEINAGKVDPTVKPGAKVSDIVADLQSRGEEEMLRTGRTFPIETVISMINQGAYQIATATQASVIRANKIRKETKRELKKTYKDFSEYEDEFDEAADGIHPARVTEEGLVLLYKSILGGHIEEREAAAEKRGKETASHKIIGPTDISGGRPSTSPASGKLTAIQAKEALEMNLTEESYLLRLEKRQENAKNLGCKTLPKTLSEPLRRPVAV